MKKKCGVTILILFFIMLLAGCAGQQTERVFDAGQYALASVEMDGHMTDAYSVYPSGAWLLLSTDGTGRLILGEDACNISWEDRNGEFSAAIDAMHISGTASDGVLTLEMGSTGMVYVFTQGGALPETAAEADSPENLLQGKWNGFWTGRMWFEEVNGEWLDFEDRTMSIDALVSLNADGEGSMILSNSSYSEDSPMAQLDITATEEKIKCESGYFMAFPLQEWGINIAYSREMSDEIESTIILHPNVWEFGHIYFPEEEEEVRELDVLRLTGRCENANGSFRYKIVLTK